MPFWCTQGSLVLHELGRRIFSMGPRVREDGVRGAVAASRMTCVGRWSPRGRHAWFAGPSRTTCVGRWPLRGRRAWFAGRFTNDVRGGGGRFANDVRGAVAASRMTCVGRWSQRGRHAWFAGPSRTTCVFDGASRTTFVVRLSLRGRRLWFGCRFANDVRGSVAASRTTCMVRGSLRERRAWLGGPFSRDAQPLCRIASRALALATRVP